MINTKHLNINNGWTCAVLLNPTFSHHRLRKREQVFMTTIQSNPLDPKTVTKTIQCNEKLGQPVVRDDCHDDRERRQNRC